MFVVVVVVVVSDDDNSGKEEKEQGPNEADHICHGRFPSVVAQFSRITVVEWREEEWDQQMDIWDSKFWVVHQQQKDEMVIAVAVVERVAAKGFPAQKQ